MLAYLKSLAHQLTPARRAAHLALGERGEVLARNYLERHAGYRIVATNVTMPLGRGLDGKKLFGEIDIVAYDGDTLAFVEVKTRSSEEVVPATRNVDLKKQRKIARTARRYRQFLRITLQPYRYDVVTVVATDIDEHVELLRGYFDDGVFRRARFFRNEYSL